MLSDNCTSLLVTKSVQNKFDCKNLVKNNRVKIIEWPTLIRLCQHPCQPVGVNCGRGLINLIKQLSKNTLGALLSHEELRAIVRDFDTVINDRPITNVPESQSNLLPITPNMYFNETKETGVLDLDV